MTKILDASALINANSIQIEGEIYTTPSVMEELKELKAQSLAEIASLKGGLQVLRPKEESLEEVKGKAEDIGSTEHLSETDLDVVALALELNGTILTDDYTLQNLAAHLDIEYEGISRGEIKRKRTFKKN